ncbi:MAG: DUF5723 family protein [Flavobacteriaceae bacterium]
MRYIFLAGFFMFGFLVMSQSYPGLSDDNYGGIHAVLVNPANIADSRLKIDVNLFSVQATVATDYTTLTFDNIKKFGDDNFALSPLQSNTVLANVDVLGTSLMFSINEKSSIGIITRLRGINNYNNINGELLESIVDGFPSNDFSFEQSNLDGTTHFWGELGLSYGRVIYDYDEHYIKAGITLKYLVGAGVAQGTSSALSGTYDATANTLALDGDFSYLISFDDDADETELMKNLSPGHGLDIGLVYEYRSRNSRLSDVGDNPRATNKYKLKLGLSLLDYGAITYKDVEQTVYALNGTVAGNEVEEDFIDALDNNFNSTTTSGDVTIALPASLNFSLDYNLLHRVYIGLNYNQTLLKKNSFYNNNRLNLLTLTPRFETRFFSAYLPIGYSKVGGTAIGFGLRMGPLMIGSGSIISNLTSKKAQSANIFLGLKIPINHKNR